MTVPQIEILVLLTVTLGAFAYGRPRYDIVALLALLASVALGLVAPREAFAGFGHPAVITVAAVLILSAGLQASGVVDRLIKRIVPREAGPSLTVFSLGGFTAFISAWMNNVGALALTMPAAIRLGQIGERLTPSILLMPIAFAAVLGGIVTLIGTPPNLIVSGFREGGFRLFDFTPVGVLVAGAGVVYLAFIGWRLIPSERRGRRLPQELFDIAPYITELAVPQTSPLAGKTVREADEALGQDVEILGIAQEERRVFAPRRERLVRAGDVLIVRADPESLKSSLQRLGLALAAAKPLPRAALESGDVVLTELVVRPGSILAGQTARLIRLRSRFAINLVGASRGGVIQRRRLLDQVIEPGDVLLLQGAENNLQDFAANHGLAPLAERKLALVTPRQVVWTVGPFIVAIALTLAEVPAEIAFLTGALIYVVSGVVAVRDMYNAIEWPVIVLLAALMPLADAVETTGLAELIAREGIAALAGGSAPVALTILLVLTMFFSDIMNNAATAAVMCPIAIRLASTLGVSADPFLMAVAVGASCAFLTPIGHQNNTLVMGPGGYRFSDYVRVGIGLEIITVIVGVPALLWFWPL